jgi:hypothetical protein
VVAQAAAALRGGHGRLGGALSCDVALGAWWHLREMHQSLESRPPVTARLGSWVEQIHAASADFLREK